jgi:hypothetical protein
MLKQGNARAMVLLAAIGLLFAAPVAAQNMGGNMGGGAGGGGAGGGAGITQGYITGPPPPQPVSGMRQQPIVSSEKQVDQPDKCRTCENCLTEQCRTMCWQRYCRR